MKKNNLKREVITFALLGGLLLGGCKNQANVINNTRVAIDSELGAGYYRIGQDGKIYKIVQEKLDPIVTVNEDGTVTYSAPDMCNTIVGFGENMRCYHLYYKPLSEEEYALDRKRGIIIATSSSYSPDGTVHETIELAPVVTYVNEPYSCVKTTTVDGEEVAEEATAYRQIAVYTAPLNATRVEGTGSNMRCFVDYVHAASSLGFDEVTNLTDLVEAMSESANHENDYGMILGR